ncbi:sulfofructose kinase [Kistimonas scapharcae]|uniref:Sulfofructose kinase n=1 Tax=Kistimonas scapharcae TaxID=1036133 RepID=A0ABP8V5G0_9GAMM
MTIPALTDIELLVHGHSCLDVYVKHADTPVNDWQHRIQAMTINGGGMAANAAVAASRLGVSTGFSGRLGIDPFSQFQIDEFHQNGVNTELVVQQDYIPSLFLALNHSDGQSEYSWYHTPHVSKVCDALTCQPSLILLDGESFDVAIALIGTARERNIPVILDACYLSDRRLALIPKVDMVIASHDFVREYMQSEDWHAGLRQLTQHCAKTIITLDNEGCIWHWQGEEGSMGCWPMDCVDGLGAGDAFHGAFCTGLLRRYTFHDNLRFASAAGALCCAREGARAGLPDMPTLTRFMASHPEPNITSI